MKYIRTKYGRNGNDRLTAQEVRKTKKETMGEQVKADVSRAARMALYRKRYEEGRDFTTNEPVPPEDRDEPEFANKSKSTEVSFNSIMATNENDVTENFRRSEVARINNEVQSEDKKTERQRLEEKHGEVWDTQELQKHFVVEGFQAPYVVVTRKSDNKKGSLEFQHSPRLYFNFHEHP